MTTLLPRLRSAALRRRLASSAVALAAISVVGGAAVDTATKPSAPTPPALPDQGYRLITASGDAASFGLPPLSGPAKPAGGHFAAAAATPTGKGYWLATAAGVVGARGDAAVPAGSTGAVRLNKPIVGMAASPTGKGYWLVASDGGIFAYGDARFLGSTAGAKAPAAPVVAVAAAGQGTPSQRAVRFAFEHLGDPYLFGGTGPSQWDCSGLMLVAYANAGVTLARTSETQWAAAPHLPSGAALRPGDLVFFGTPADVHHVGVYVGNDQMIDAPHTGAVVRFDSVVRPDYMGASRPAP